MVLPIKHDVIEVNNVGVCSLLAEFMYGWPLHNRTAMVLVTDYEGTRYYYNLQFYRDKQPEGIRIEQLRQMIMDAQFVNVNIRMYNFDDVQCTVIPSVAYGFVTGMNLQLC